MIIWLTGNTGAGKTTLAYKLNKIIDAVVLDGDEMRESISLGAGFTKEAREEHNLRVARLAKVLNRQMDVIVSVIAPFSSTREKISEICNPIWIYLKSPDLGADKPYEEPKNALITLDQRENTVEEEVIMVMEGLESYL